MKCSSCFLYSRGLGRCTQGKINPLKVSIANGVSTAKMMGLSYFCAVDAECVVKRSKIAKAMTV